jgi:hypothetical protein
VLKRSANAGKAATNRSKSATDSALAWLRTKSINSVVIVSLKSAYLTVMVRRLVGLGREEDDSAPSVLFKRNVEEYDVIL